MCTIVLLTSRIRSQICKVSHPYTFASLFRLDIRASPANIIFQGVLQVTPRYQRTAKAQVSTLYSVILVNFHIISFRPSSAITTAALSPDSVIRTHWHVKIFRDSGTDGLPWHFGHPYRCRTHFFLPLPTRGSLVLMGEIRRYHDLVASNWPCEAVIVCTADEICYVGFSSSVTLIPAKKSITAHTDSVWVVMDFLYPYPYL